MKKIFAICMLGMMLVLAGCSGALADIDPSGYTALSGNFMGAKQFSEGHYDLIGFIDGLAVQTTYDYSSSENSGYPYMQMGMDSATIVPGVNALQATDGRFAQLTYTVTAGAQDITNGMLAVHADVQIGTEGTGGDKATINAIKNGDNKIGITMKNETTEEQFSLYFREAIGVTDVQTCWFGYYGNRKDNAFYDTNIDSYSGADSGFAVSWQGINLKAGESKTFSIIVGVGEAADPIAWDKNNSPLKLDLTSIEQGTDSVEATGKANEENKNLMLYYSINGSEFAQVQRASVTTETGKTIITGKVPTADLPVGEHKLAFFIRDTTSMSMSSTEEITLVVKAADPNKNPNVVGAIKDLPQTGDNSSLGLYIMMLGFASLAMVVMKRRRVEN